MNITIRKATEDDQEIVAWAVLRSSRAGKTVGIFDLIFETNDDKVLLQKLQALVTTQTKSYCHVNNFLVAEVAGDSAGVLCGYEPRIATQEIFSQALAEVGYDESYKERIAAYLLCAPAIDRQTWVLDFMEEKPEYGSFEILKELVQKSLLTARLKGYRKVQTMLDIGCIVLLRVYEKLGFTYVDEKRAQFYQDVFGRPGIKRLVIHL